MDKIKNISFTIKAVQPLVKMHDPPLPDHITPGPLLQSTLKSCTFYQWSGVTID